MEDTTNKEIVNSLDDPEYPPAIILGDPGDWAEGKIERWSQGPNHYPPPDTTTIAVIRKDDGKLGSLWLNNTVLVSKFAQARPKPGERVRVLYKGKRESGSGTQYRDYEVTFPDREPYEPDWGPLDEPAPWEES